MPSATGLPLPVSVPASIPSLLPAVSSVDQLPSKQDIRLEMGPYIARLAMTDRERIAAFRLRFLVFNLEMQEGLESAYIDGYDVDRYDEVCDHLIVEERATGEIVGTYRLQMGDVAKRFFGYYSEQEFDFTPYESMREHIVELGRACIHRDHRSTEVLHLLWRGIARYALANGARYMMGCCSLTSQDPEMGQAVYRSLAAYMVEPELQTMPTAAFRMPESVTTIEDVRAPKLLRAYLTIGAKICGAPAIDREFKTIDFLTLLDLQTLHPRVATRFLEGC
ncbi:GNAT family N-acetyltransferase [Granulicella arctica]|uniref:Putative hemolysin n=1 Tax=Granulicella arctica TaxID=940613 RepID=A0A7Y9TSY8_9BACT|nr:GNAT family N-acyltransferase [Granulicella arctica]NYF79468.1 putative hemolysin [Granulicella arctica]